ncbi:MAG TPA: acyltransferase [Actinocrinis sp.]|nr:acyltransferase [Actinocrinis sp.]
MTATARKPGSDPGRVRLDRLPSLTGMRFFAALAVFLYHLTIFQFSPFGGAFGARAGWLFGKSGWAGVSFFFVLSGFVLTWSARPGDGARPFIRRRLVKLFPSHLLTFGLAMALFASAYTTWREWLPNILLLHAWSPDYHVSFSVNIPSWSLSCELLFYVCFPVLLRLIKKIDAKHLWSWVIGLVALDFAVPVVAYATLPNAPQAPGFPVGLTQNWLVYQFPPVRMIEFVVGMLMARIVLSDKWINVRILPALALFAGAYTIGLNVPYLYSLAAVMLIPIALLVAAVAVADLRGTTSVLRGRVMTHLGDVSFAFYLTQAIVLMYGTRFLNPHKPYDIVAGLALCLFEGVVVMALAQAIHAWVEMPMMRRFSRPRGSRGGSAGPRLRPVKSATAVTGPLVL